MSPTSCGASVSDTGRAGATHSCITTNVPAVTTKEIIADEKYCQADIDPK